MDAETVVLLGIVFLLVGVPGIGMLVALQRSIGRWKRAVLTDDCVLCDAEVDLADGHYACAGCGFDSRAAREPGVQRLIEVAHELRQAEREAARAARMGAVLDPGDHLVGVAAPKEHVLVAAHAARSEALRLLDHAARVLPAFETAPDGTQRPLHVVPASDRVRDLVPAVRAARAAVRRLVLAG